MEEAESTMQKYWARGNEILPRLSQFVWTTTPRGTVDQELKL